VHLERDVLIAAGVHIPSGSETHGTDDLSIPFRDQPGRQRLVRIGAGSWIGSAAVVMADVGRDSIVGAGSVVNRSIPDRVLAAGVPARVLRTRELRTA
jgi:acetyltransferase-like isoleucine patch superfamily enzyme